MFKLSALNEKEGENVTEVEKPAKDTREAQEAQAFKLYNEALCLQQNNQHDEAVSVYEKLLQTPLVIESATTLVNEDNEAIEHPLKDPGLILKYSTHKNVANICASKGDTNRAMENYLQAVMLDTSDVTLWYKIGVLAAKLSNLHLSRRALTQGLQCNPNHWPCLDSLITICYAILDYENCLMWISKALKKDPCYKKGIYFRRKMISECPHLKKDFDHIFQDCGKQVFETKISDEDSKVLLDEALTLRENNRKLCIKPPPPIVPLTQPLKSLTWLNLGKSLLATHEYIDAQEEPITLSCKINMILFEDDKAPKDSSFPVDSNRDKVASSELEGNSDATATTSADCPDVAEPSTSVSTSKRASESDVVMNESIGDSLPRQGDDTTPSCSNVTDTEAQTTDLSHSSSAMSLDVSGSQKKSAKRKRAQEKVVDQERQSKRRSSRMKKSASIRPEAEPEQIAELDFRQSLLHLLPKSLLPNRDQNLSLDLDSDTNSQDSTFIHERDLKSHQEISSTGNTERKEESSAIENRALSIDINVSVMDSPSTEPALSEVKLGKPVGDHELCESEEIGSTGSTQLSAIDDKLVDDKAHENILVKKEKEVVDEGKTEMIVKTDSPNKDQEKSGDYSKRNLSSNSHVDSEHDEEYKSVKIFIDKYNDKNFGIFHVMHQYLKVVARRTHLPWEDGLSDVFLSMYSIVQPTIHMESFDKMDLDTENKIFYSYNMITHLECVLDKKYDKHSVDYKYVPTSLEYADMKWIIDASYRPQVLEEDSMLEHYCYKYFVLRYHWVRATYFLLMGDKDSTFRELTMCLKMCVADTEVTLCHLKHFNKINKVLIQNRLDSLKRFQVLEEIESLFEIKKYEEIIKSLLPNFDDQELNLIEQKTQKMSDNDNDNDTQERPKLDTQERPKLLKYLVDSAVAINDSKTLIRSLVYVLSESTDSISRFEKPDKVAHKSNKNEETSSPNEQWNSLTILCCKELHGVFSRDIGSEILNELTKLHLTKLAASLLAVIHFSMTNLAKQYSSVQFSSIGTTKANILPETFDSKNSLLPWVLLFHVLKFEEGKQSLSTTLEAIEDIPGSYKLLITAHDWLGDKCICCIDGGIFLRLLLKNLLSLLKIVEEKEIDVGVFTSIEVSNDSKRSLTPVADHKQTLKSEIEQCFFCLYGFPNKILKSSTLVDHSSQQSALTWKEAIIMFDYFRPRVLPGFDSYKANTMLGETASLVMRIIKLVPEYITTKIESSLETLDKFIGENDALMDLNLPDVGEGIDKEAVKDIYYLLADYYFKNKEMAQAAKYYLYDLCINPERFDSWAGLALAKSSLIDEKLRLCVAKSQAEEMSIIELSKVPLMCFEKAMTIEKSSTTLWIEYGSLAYWIHSFCSRQKRWKLNMPDSEILSLDSKKSAMLNLAQRCFEFALKCDAEDINNEEWLIQYMLGKVAEKKCESVQNYLPRYSKAAGLLHRKHAKYPKKIQFKSYQSDYAIEALELHYRLHTSILKLIQKEINVLDGFESRTKMLNEDDYDLFDDLIEEASVSHFVRREVLPYSQLEDSSQVKKNSPAKLLTPTPPAQTSSLTMGSLVPDSIATALQFQLSADSSQSGPSAIDDFSMDMDNMSPKSSSLQSPPISPSNVNNEADKKDQQGSTEAKETSQKPTFTDEARMQRALVVMAGCVSGLHLCLGRLPQHYKSLHRLALLFMHCSKERRHAKWSRDILLGSETPWQQLAHMPSQGLLSERNKTNLFNGVWKIPVDEIDRPGSFGSHLYRCILLLLDVFLELYDHNKLFYMHNMLNRNPDQGRKYLRDADRICASKRALSYSIKALQRKVLSNVPTSPKSATQEDKNKLMHSIIGSSHFKSSEALSQLLDASKLYLQKQRIGSLRESSSNVYDVTEPHKELLITAFQKYTLACPQAIALFPNVDVLSTSSGLERIIKFCQQYAVMSKAATGGSSNMLTSSKSDIKGTLGTTKKTDKIEEKTSSEISDKVIKDIDSKEKAQSTAMALKEHFSATEKKRVEQNNEKSQTEASLLPVAKASKTDENSSSSIPIESESDGNDTTASLKEIATSQTLNKSETKLPSVAMENVSSKNRNLSDSNDLNEAERDYDNKNVKSGKNIDISMDIASEGELMTQTTVTTIFESSTGNIKQDIDNNAVNRNDENKTVQVTCVANNEGDSGGEIDNVLKPEQGSSSAVVPETINVTNSNSSQEERKVADATNTTGNETNAKKPSGVTLVKKGAQVYTKIMPSRPYSGITHPTRSAFTPTKLRITPELQSGKSPPKNLKRSPQMNRVAALSRTNPKAPLLRSTSMPVSIEDEKVTPKRQHRTLHRTGSISDYTKQKLKSSILMRTSASLVRKPSITEREIEEILTDPESSQSEEEEEMEGIFKPVGGDENAVSEQAISSNVITRPVAVTPVLSPHPMDVPITTAVNDT